jgi:ribA/ribD-fused uncharacterized protein
MEEINQFKGEHAFLSNFFIVQVTMDGVTYPSVENAYQAAKTFESRTEFAHCTPGEAKRMGQQVDLRSDWENVKDRVMFHLLEKKFQSPYLRKKLVATHPRKLVEGNWWGDEYWGRCRGKGQNKLGQMLMKLRERYRQEEEEAWATRVAE